MEQQQWEFCELYLSQNQGYVTYYSPDGGVTTQRLKPTGGAGDMLLGKGCYKSWDKAVALLGGFGWELVSTQYGCDKEGHLDWTHKVAWFKRPIVPGRAVSAPALTDVVRTET